MTRTNLKEVFVRLVPKWKLISQFIMHVYSVQELKTARLDFSAAAKVLGVDWKTVSRLCDKLAKAEIIFYEGNGLRLNSAVLFTD